MKNLRNLRPLLTTIKENIKYVFSVVLLFAICLLYGCSINKQTDDNENKSNSYIIVYNEKDTISSIEAYIRKKIDYRYNVLKYGDYDLIMDLYGTPHKTSYKVLKKGINLYEFENGLLEYIPTIDNDSLVVTHYYYENGNISTDIWWTIIDGHKKILEVLEYNNEYIQF